MALWLVLPGNIRVCMPLVPLISLILHPLQFTAMSGFVSLLMEAKKQPLGKLKIPFSGCLSRGSVPRGEARPIFDPWLPWRDVLLLYPHFCSPGAFCNSNSLRSRLDEKVILIQKIYKL